MRHDYQQTDKQGANRRSRCRSARRCASREGDELDYHIEGDRVVLTKARRVPVEDPFAVFDEWSSEADIRAYGDL